MRLLRQLGEACDQDSDILLGLWQVTHQALGRHEDGLQRNRAP